MIPPRENIHLPDDGFLSLFVVPVNMNTGEACPVGVIGNKKMGADVTICTVYCCEVFINYPSQLRLKTCIY